MLHCKSRYFKSYSWTKTDTLSSVTKQSAESASDQKSEMEEQAKSRLNAGSGSLIEQQPILKQGRRGIKRPDITVQENDKKRPRKRKRWWSGCKQFVDFLFMKKHESNIISQFDILIKIKLRICISILRASWSYRPQVDRLCQNHQESHGHGHHKEKTRIRSICGI